MRVYTHTGYELGRVGSQRTTVLGGAEAVSKQSGDLFTETKTWTYGCDRCADLLAQLAAKDREIEERKESKRPKCVHGKSRTCKICHPPVTGMHD